MPDSPEPCTYPDLSQGPVDPRRIDLVGTVTDRLMLKKGWNFISIDLNLADKRIGYALNSISNNLLHVSDEKKWWDKQAGGSLKSIEPKSYYIKVDNDCMLLLTGTKEKLPKTITLKKGWQSMPYLYRRSRPAIGTGIGTGQFNGLFKDITDDMVWVKVGSSPNKPNWAAPNVNDVSMMRWKGIFIKLKKECTLTFEKE